MSLERIQALVDTLAAKLGRAVVADDQNLRLVAVSEDFGDADPARIWSLLNRRTRPEDVRFAEIKQLAGPGYVPANPELQLARRLCVPIRCHGILLGFVWIIDRHADLTEEQVVAAARTADELGVVLHRRLVAKEGQREFGQRLVDELLGSDAAARQDARRTALDSGLLDGEEHVAVLLAGRRPADEHEDTHTALSTALELFCRGLPLSTALAACHPRQAVVILAQRREFGPEQLADAAAGLLRELARQPGNWRVGVGGPVAGLLETPSAYRQASAALSALDAQNRPGGVAEWSKLGPYALLGQLDSGALGDLMVPDGVRALLDNRMLLSTVETYLDLGGDVQGTARELAVHRTTLYYRLERAEQISGLNLRDGLDRLTLHLALKLRRMTDGATCLPTFVERPVRNFPRRAG